MGQYPAGQPQHKTTTEALDEVLSLPNSTTFPRATPFPQITIEQEQGRGISVHIETARLVVSSVARSDAKEYHEHLFGDQRVMRKFATGEVRDRSYVDGRLDIWRKRWESGDPFSGFTIRSKAGEFIGHLALGHGDLPGHSELAYAVRPSMWGQGFGREAAQVVVKGLSPLLRAYGFSVEGRRLGVLDATARPDNVASARILLGVGMRVIASGGKFGGSRDYFQGAVALPDPTKCWEMHVYRDRTVITENE